MRSTSVPFNFCLACLCGLLEGRTMTCKTFPDARCIACALDLQSLSSKQWLFSAFICSIGVQRMKSAEGPAQKHVIFFLLITCGVQNLFLCGTS